MAGIITSVEDDIKKLQELKQAIADVKNELKGINIKVDIDIKENLEKQLQGLMTQYNDVATRISEVQGKIMILKNDVQKAMEAQSPASDISKLITDGLRNMEQFSQSASQSVESLNNTLDHNKQEIESNTQALNENAAATEKVRLSNAQLVAEISEIANTDYENFVIRATNGTQDYTNAINQANSDIARLVSIQGSLNERFQEEEIGVEEYKNAMDEVQAAIQRTEAAFDSLRDARSGNMGGNVDTSGLDKLDENVHILLLNLAELEVENGKTKQSLRDLNKEFKEGSITEEDYIKKKAVIQNSLDEEAKAIRDVKTELKLQRQAVEEVEGSYNQLSAQYSLNKMILNRLSEEQLQDTEEYKKLLEETEEIYERMKQYQASTGKHQLNVGNYPSFSDSFKDIGNIEGLKEKFEEASIAIGEMQTSISNLSQTSSEYVAKGQELRNEISILTSSFNEAVKSGMPVEEQSQAIDTIKSKIQEYGSVMMQSSAAAQAAYELQQDSIKALESELTNLQTALQTALAGGNTESADALAQEIANVSEELAKAKEKLEDLNVAAQNTKNSFNRVAEEQAKMVKNIDANWLDRLRDGFINVGNSISEYTSKITNAATGNGKFQQSLSSFKDGLNQLPIPLGKSVDGVVAMTRAMWAMVATPVGAMLTGIVLALQALFQWFTKDAEGQRVFAKASAYLGSLLSSMTDIIITIGKYLYHAFADAGAPLNSFTNSLKTTFVSAVKTVSELVGGLGKALRGIFDKDWGTFYDGVSQMGKGLLDAGKTMVSAVDTAIKGVTGSVKLVGKALTDDNLAKDIGKHWNDAIPKAKESAALAERETNARIEAQKAQEKAAKLDAEIAKKREEIYNLTGKAKDAAIEETKALMKAKYDDQIKVQKEQLDILKTKNSLHTSSLEDLAKERDLNIQLLRTQAQREASTRMMTRMQQSNLNKMKTSEKGTMSKSNALTAADTKWEEVLRKNANERVKVEMDIEDQITEARIKAMEDGAEKIRAERERQNEKELDQIKKQRDAAIEAERNRQKAEFDAEQAAIKAAGGKTEKWDESKVDETFINKIKEQYEEIYNNIRKVQERDLMTAELTAMRDYLKEYGTFQQQKLAIAQEYAEKIRKAETEGERLSLEKQQQAALQSVEISALKQEIDWKGLLGDFGNLLQEQIQPTLDKLKAYSNSEEFKQANISDQQIIYDLISQLEAKVSDGWNGMFRNLGDAVQKVKDAELEKEAALKKSIAADEEYAKALKKNTVKGKNGDYIDDKNGEVKAAQQKATEAANELADAQTNLLNVQNEMNDAATRVRENLGNLTNGLQQLNSGSMSGVLQGLNSLAKMFGNNDFSGTLAKGLSTVVGGAFGTALAGPMGGEIVEGVFALLDVLGNGIENLFSNLIDTILGAISGLLSSVLSLDIPMAIGTSLVNGLKDIGNALTFGGVNSWFGGADYDKYNDALEYWGGRLEIWGEAVDKYTQEISKGYGAQSYEAAQQAKYYLDKEMEGQMDILNARLSSGASKGSHSLGYRMWTGSYHSSLGRTWHDVASEIGISSMADLYTKSADELRQIKADYSDLWVVMDDKFKEGLEELIEMKDQAKEIEDILTERLTGVSFEGFRDGFFSTLSDMSKGWTDMVDDFGDKLRTSILNSLLSKHYDDKIKKLYAQWGDVFDDQGNVNQAKADAVRAEQEQLAKEMAEDRDRWAEAFGFNDKETISSQQSTTNAASSLTEDTGKAIEGRATALQIAGEEIKNQNISQSQSLNILSMKANELLAVDTNIKNIFDDTRDIIAKSYIELVLISENTGNSAKFLKDIKADISEVRKNTSRI